MEKFQLKQDTKHMTNIAFPSYTNTALTRIYLRGASEALYEMLVLSEGQSLK